MRRVRSLAKGLVATVVVIVVAALIGIVGLLAAITGRALPQVTGTLGVPGLEAPVTVHRDRSGIAQIVADTPHDLFMAQGYVHAQDRFWQMEFWRHISSGRLSELFGESQLDADRLIRTLDWRGAAQRDLDAMSDAARLALASYAEGVNAWLDANRDRASLALIVAGLQSGLGSGLDGYAPEPWTPLDSAAWQKVQSFNLGGNYDVEIFRMLADAHLGDPALTDELLPPGSPTSPVITPSGLPGSGGAGALIVSETTTASPATGEPSGGAIKTADRPDLAAGWSAVAHLRGQVLETAGLDGGGGLSNADGIGSNNWVVAPSRSASGQALLANDPHLGLAMPSVWYMNGLRCRTVSASCPYDVVGVSFPGAPGVILGHNARVAWGATNVRPDVQDLFIETVDPADTANYLFEGRSIPFDFRTETIKVSGGDPVEIEVRSTRHGPILNDVDERLADAPLLALRWTATAEADGTVDAILALNTAGSFKEFRAAFEPYGSPSQHFVYADVDGHIGYVLPGLIPIRPDGDRGGRPVDGASGEHEWAGYIPFDDLPWQLDPEPGAIVTANNAAVDGDYPFFMGQDWDVGDRAQRILDLLDALDEDGLTTDEFRTIQADTYLLRADRVVPRLELMEPEPGTADGRELLERIRSWDRRCDIDSRGCAAYISFEFTLLRAMFDDDLGPLAKDYVGGGGSQLALVRLLDDAGSRWWQDARTSGPDRPEDVIARALDDAAAQLREAFGDPDRWTWGRLHRGTFREQTLGSSGIGPLEWYFNQGPFPVPGAAGAVNNTYYRTWRAFADPYDPEFAPIGIEGLFAVSNGPSYRLTIDMGDLDGARIVQTTGQSGNPFDRHYGDLVDLWARNETVPLPFSRDALTRSTAAMLTLVPAR